MGAKGAPVATTNGRWLPVVLVAALAPACYFAYSVGAEWFRHGRTLLEPPLSSGMLVASAGLAVAGALAVVGWRRGYRATVLASVGFPLVWPWLYTSVPAGGTHVLIPTVSATLVAVGEALVRHPDRVDGLFAGRDGRFALAAGLVHFAFGFALQVLARPYWLDVSAYSGNSALLMAAVMIVCGLGLVAAGASPVLLWCRYRLALPGLVVLGWALAALWWVHRHLGHLVLSEFRGIGWAHPTPGPDYMATWMVPLSWLAVVAGLEFGLRWLLYRATDRRAARG